MSHQPMSIEAISQPTQLDQGPQTPELRLIQGYGEAPPDDLVTDRPELYVVPDVAESAGETLDVAEEDSSESSLYMAAKVGSRVLAIARTAAESVTSLYEMKHKGGGGGWLIREYIRKLQAKEAKAKAQAEGHEISCDCPTCSSADNLGV